MAIKSYNGVAYDDSVDYSAAIEQAKASGQDTSALQAAREAKIADKYGGNEPTMYGSNKTYSQVQNDSNYSDTIRNAVATSSKVNGYDYTRPSSVSSNNDDYYTSYGHQSANMSRNTALAGMSVKQGQYTVTYDENGYATKAVKDGGKSATGAIQTSHANDSVYHQLAYKAAEAGDWDTVGRYLNLIADTYSRTGPATDYDTGINMKAANLYGAELQNQFKYSATDYYNKLYDQAYGEGSAAAWDATGGAVKTYADLVAQMGADAAQQLIAAQQVGTNGTAGTNLNNVATLLSGGMTGGFTAGGFDDMTQYINDLYAQNLEAELAALKSAYDANVAEMESQNDRIAEQYRAARNQVAGQNALERQRMNEFALAQGLNSGASGQAALAQSAAYQGNLGNLWAQEAQNQADVDMAIAQLMNQYNSNVQQVTANINAQRSAALYDEMVRQQQLAIQQQEAARDYALSMLSAGVMPDSGTLSGAGISANEAAGMLQVVLGTGTPATSAPIVTAPTASTPTATPKGNLTSYNNGNLTTAQVKQLQEYFGATPDGKWGPDSTRAAGGLSANSAWNAYLDAQSVNKRTSLNWDQDEGDFTWNGQKYYDVGNLLSDIENANLTAAEQQKLAQKFAMFGFDISFN